MRDVPISGGQIPAWADEAEAGYHLNGLRSATASVAPEEDQALAALRPEPTDDFGVPVGFFGTHPEAVWGAIGRTVAVGALLEDRLVTLLQTLRGKTQADFAKFGAGEVVARLRKATPADDEPWNGFAAWLDRVGEALEWRNDVAHNLWPAQPSNRLFGHRLDRTGKRRTVETTTEDLQRRLVEVVAVVREWDGWFALANRPSTRG